MAAVQMEQIPQSRILEGKYLTFLLRNEVYGIGIRYVKEIIGLLKITPIPESPDYVKGVINLRGKVIPVIDLRSRFSMQEVEHTNHTCIIVVEIANDRGSVPVGVLVDEVSEVLNIKSDDIDETPSFGFDLKTDYILGIAKVSGGVKMLLDINRMLTTANLAFEQAI